MKYNPIQYKVKKWRMAEKQNPGDQKKWKKREKKEKKRKKKRMKHGVGLKWIAIAIHK